MPTYKLLREWVTPGPSPQPLPAGTLVGDGTAYPLPKLDHEGKPYQPFKKGSTTAVEVPTPKPTPPSDADKVQKVVDSGASPGGEATPGHPKDGPMTVDPERDAKLTAGQDPNKPGPAKPPTSGASPGKGGPVENQQPPEKPNENLYPKG